MEWTAPRTAMHLWISDVINAPMALFLFFLGLPLCQSEFFKSSLESLGSLKETSTFLAQSKIECSAGCLIRTRHHECTAFNLDGSTNVCTCGRKSFSTLPGNGDSRTLYISSTCQISGIFAGADSVMFLQLSGYIAKGFYVDFPGLPEVGQFQTSFFLNAFSFLNKFFIPDMDHILISGGNDLEAGSQLTQNNYLIPLPWASNQGTGCPPPADLANPDKGHIIGRSGQTMVKCGGFANENGCENYNPLSGLWEAVALLTKGKIYFSSVQLDIDRLWIARKLFQSRTGTLFILALAKVGL